MASVESQPSQPPGCPRCAELEGMLRSALGEVAGLEQRVRELEARLNQHSGNSSKPPSSDPPSAPPRPARPPTGRRPGGQPGHEGHRRVRLPASRVDRVVDHVPGACRGCGASLPFGQQPHDPEPSWRQVAELPEVAAVVTEHRGHARTCDRCGEVTRQAVPEGVREHTLGPRLSALLAYLSGRCHAGRRLAEEFCEDVLGVPVALGTVSNYEEEACGALSGAYAQAADHVRTAPNRNVDETGWPGPAGQGDKGEKGDKGAKDAKDEKGKRRRHWLWVAATKACAVFAVCPGRGREGLEAVLGEDPRAGPGVAGVAGVFGVVTSDRLATYDVLPAGMRQVCWAHLLRDFTRLSEPGGHTEAAVALGGCARDAAAEVLRLWRDWREGRVTRAALDEGLGRQRRRLEEILSRGAKLPDPRDKKAASLFSNLLAAGPALWTFAGRSEADVGGVEPTNNHAERCLRPAVLWRKNSFGCASERGCRFVERMLTVVTTLRLRARSVFDYLCRAVEAHRLGQPAPPLLT